jgi:hypothetical protein
MPAVQNDVNYKERFRTAAYTEKWAVTMTKVRIRQAVAHTPFPRWHFVSFAGPDGGESRGVVDLIAIRKDHALAGKELKRGDTFQIVLIQVKGGYAARPTAEDGKRLRAVAKLHHAHAILLASWKKGTAPKFYTMRPRPRANETDWLAVEDLKTIFN